MEAYGTPYNSREAHGVVTQVTWKPSEKLSCLRNQIEGHLVDKTPPLFILLI